MDIRTQKNDHLLSYHMIYKQIKLADTLYYNNID